MLLKLAPFFLQGLLMTVDEVYCHRRRKLMRWERWGHPADTALFAGTLGLLLILPREALWVYVSAAVFSSLFVTKDEWQHANLCTGFENWLHALLFMIHPLIFVWAGHLWWSRDPHALPVIVFGVATATAFFFYQAIYWNVVRNDQQ